MTLPKHLIPEKADHYFFLLRKDYDDLELRKAVEEIVELVNKDGARSYRITAVDCWHGEIDERKETPYGWWFESWKVQLHFGGSTKDIPFNPPALEEKQYTY